MRLDRRFPRVSFRETPMRSIYNGLIRSMITGGFTFNDNHARDFFHSVTSTRCADMVLLDGHWAEQVRQLRLPEGFVRVYTANDVDRFLHDLEQRPTSRSGPSV